MLMKDRSATKRRDRRKIVCAVSSAVYGNCHQKCAYCAYLQIRHRIRWALMQGAAGAGAPIHWAALRAENARLFSTSYVALCWVLDHRPYLTLPIGIGWPLDDPHQPDTLD